MTQFTTTNDWQIITGTSLQSYIEATYDELVAIFGQPSKGDGYKVDAQWFIQFTDSTVASIYNYKDGHNYEGEDGTDTDKITEWHIGGHNKQAVKLVAEAVDSYRAILGSK